MSKESLSRHASEYCRTSRRDLQRPPRWNQPTCQHWASPTGMPVLIEKKLSLPIDKTNQLRYSILTLKGEALEAKGVEVHDSGHRRCHRKDGGGRAGRRKVTVQPVGAVKRCKVHLGLQAALRGCGVGGDMRKRQRQCNVSMIEVLDRERGLRRGKERSEPNGVEQSRIRFAVSRMASRLLGVSL